MNDNYQEQMTTMEAELTSLRAVNAKLVAALQTATPMLAILGAMRDEPGKECVELCRAALAAAKEIP